MRGKYLYSDFLYQQHLCPKGAKETASKRHVRFYPFQLLVGEFLIKGKLGERLQRAMQALVAEDDSRLLVSQIGMSRHFIGRGTIEIYLFIDRSLYGKPTEDRVGHPIDFLQLIHPAISSQVATKLHNATCTPRADTGHALQQQCVGCIQIEHCIRGELLYPIETSMPWCIRC